MTNVKKMLLGCYIHLRQRRLRDTPPAKPDKEKLLYPFRLLIHPLAVFQDLKYEKKASMGLANLLVLLFFLEALTQALCTGYLFHPQPDSLVRLLPALLQSAGALLLWTICNWATYTLIDGEGTMRDIWIAAAYSLTPWILLGFLGILLSNVLSLDEAMIYQTFQVVGAGWSLLLVFLGMMIVHQYTVKKTIVSIIITLLAILAVCFLLLLFFSIAQQILGFATSIAQELTYR